MKYAQDRNKLFINAIANDISPFAKTHQVLAALTIFEPNANIWHCRNRTDPSLDTKHGPERSIRVFNRKK
jgi:hypothetical protein